MIEVGRIVKKDYAIKSRIYSFTIVKHLFGHGRTPTDIDGMVADGDVCSHPPYLVDARGRFAFFELKTDSDSERGYASRCAHVALLLKLSHGGLGNDVLFHVVHKDLHDMTVSDSGKWIDIEFESGIVKWKAVWADASEIKETIFFAGRTDDETFRMLEKTCGSWIDVKSGFFQWAEGKRETLDELRLYRKYGEDSGTSRTPNGQARDR